MAAVFLGTGAWVRIYVHQYEPNECIANGTLNAKRKILSPQTLNLKIARFPLWARPGTDTPGPAGYSVDEYTRKEALDISWLRISLQFHCHGICKKILPQSILSLSTIEHFLTVVFCTLYYIDPEHPWGFRILQT